MNHRFNHHKEASKTGTSVVYTYINSIGWDKVEIELIEDFPCTIKSELNEREEYYISQSKTDNLCLNIKEGETTKDGMFTLKTAECLGACGYGPMLQCGKKYHEHLTREKVDELIAAYRSGELPK